MLRVLGRLPVEKFHFACSGGSDSMVFLDFLRRYPKNRFDVLHFNHGTPYCDEAERFVHDYCERNSIDCHVGRISRGRRRGESQEEYWRNERYGFFSRFSDAPIVTCHHLGDAVETWVMSSLHGEGKLIPYRNVRYNIIRPFLCTPKSEIEDWARRHGVEFVTDGSNFDISLNRNFVRLKMMDLVREINPGIEKTIAKKIRSAYRLAEDGTAHKKELQR